MPEPDREILERLEADGLVRQEPGGARATRRWQGAMARAALELYHRDAPWKDLRLPIAVALVELYGDLPDDQIVRYVETLLPIQAQDTT